MDRRRSKINGTYTRTFPKYLPIRIKQKNREYYGGFEYIHTTRTLAPT